MAEEKIILTKEEIAVIEKHNAGEFDSLTATDEEKKALGRVIDAAQEFCEKLDAYEEVDDSFIEWYYNKYKAQQK